MKHARKLPPNELTGDCSQRTVRSRTCPPEAKCAPCVMWRPQDATQYRFKPSDEAAWERWDRVGVRGGGGVAGSCPLQCHEL